MTDHDPKLVRFDRRHADRDVVKFRFNVQRAKVTPALSVVGERAIAPAEFEFALDRFAERLVGQLRHFLRRRVWSESSAMSSVSGRWMPVEP